MTRQQPALHPPGDVAAVTTTSRRRPLYRACHRRHPQPWWHSARDRTDDPGRFDLTHPRGTCYWATAAATAIIETTVDPDQIDPPVISLAALAALTVWRADDVPAARSRLADTTVASVPELTAEIATIVPYTLPWAWADAFDTHGHNGILYRARLGMGDAIALFGPYGRPTDAPAATPQPATAHYGDLPPAYRAGVGSVGPLATLPRVTPPSPDP